MDTEGFVRWALDDARTIEERYTTEVLVEDCLIQWHSRKGTITSQIWDKRRERERQSKLNPAYEPKYTEQDLRRAAEVFPNKKEWRAPHPYNCRPIRDLHVLRFLSDLRELHAADTEVTDLSPVADMNLRMLHFGSTLCEDFRPLARCGALQELTLKLVMHWPDLTGLEQLSQLRKLFIDGNLLALGRPLTWPNVKTGRLICEPLAARSVRDLPQFPECEFLTLGGIERLDGIEAFPKLRNLTLETKVRDFGPITTLQQLTSFTCNAAEPLDVSPLAKLPNLLIASFNTKHNYGIDKAKPRDFSPLVEAPQLRELKVEGCPPVKTEVAALNAGFASWDELFLLEKPRPLPSLRLISTPHSKLPRSTGANSEESFDPGVREAEGRWMQKFVAKTIKRRVGSSDWGEVTVNPEVRGFFAMIESFGVVEKMPVIIEAIREVLSKLRYDYSAGFMISLKVPERKKSAAELALEQKFLEQEEEADFERRDKERQEYLDRLHRYELKKQEGQKIKPEEFAAPSEIPVAEPESDDDEESNEPGDGDVITKKKPEPPPSLFDEDEHPLADQYRVMGNVTLSEAWFGSRDPHMVTYLMGRNPDEVIPEDPAK